MDPTPYLYDTTMYTMAGLMSVAALSHFMVGPVDPNRYEPIEEPKPETVVEVEPVMKEEDYKEDAGAAKPKEP